MLLLGSTLNLLFILKKRNPHLVFLLTLYGLREEFGVVLDYHWLRNFCSMHVKGNGRKGTLVQAWIAIAHHHG